MFGRISENRMYGERSPRRRAASTYSRLRSESTAERTVRAMMRREDGADDDDQRRPRAGRAPRSPRRRRSRRGSARSASTMRLRMSSSVPRK